MLNVIAIIVSKMTSYRKGTVQMREESEILGMTQLRDIFCIKCDKRDKKVRRDVI